MLLADPQRIEDEIDEATQKLGDAVEDVTDKIKMKGSDAAIAADESKANVGPICSNCKVPMPAKQMSVCPSCGYYAALGICIDLDHQWEKLAGAPSEGEADANVQPKSHLQIWIDLVPGWGWQLLAYNVIILIASVAVRFSLPAGVVRTAWSFSQLVAGIAALLTCHVLAYLIAIVEDASLSSLDVIIKPIRVWKDVLRDLPNKLRLVSGATCGVTAALAAMLIIGSLNYAVLLDWGFKQPPKQNLLGAIVAHAQEVGVGDEGSLEDAMDEFVNQAGEGEKDKGPKLRADCLIIGYTTAGKNPERVTSLVLAREHLQKLIYVGTVRGGFDEELHEYLPQFREIPRKQPFVFVPIAIDAQWVQPYYTCRVKYLKEDQPTGKLERIQYDTILGKINF